MALLLRKVDHLKMVAEKGVTTADKALADATSADPAKYQVSLSARPPPPLVTTASALTLEGVCVKQSPVDSTSMFKSIMRLKAGIGTRIADALEKVLAVARSPSVVPLSLCLLLFHTRRHI